LQFAFCQSLLEETIDRGMRRWLANRIKDSLECFIVLRMKNPYETDALGACREIIGMGPYWASQQKTIDVAVGSNSAGLVPCRLCRDYP
jgi:hypothetical protein